MSVDFAKPGKRQPRVLSLARLALGAALLSACAGAIGDGARHDPPETAGDPTRPAPAPGGAPALPGTNSPPGGDTPAAPPLAPGKPAPGLEALGRVPTGIARLSREELRATLRSALGVDAGADLELLPADSVRPFDNDYTLQVPSKALVEGLEALAERTTAKVLANTGARNAVVGCTPTGPADTACLRAFIERIGRRLLRRPLAPAEVDELARFSERTRARNDFYAGVGLVLRTLLGDLELVYRIEIGTPVPGSPGVVRLNDFELGARLAFLLWGEGPDDRLLADAAAGTLSKPDGVRAAVTRLLADPRGTRRLQRFHALWLGYEALPFPDDLASRARREADALVQRLVVERKRPWAELLTTRETFVDATLARHYGLTPPAGSDFTWTTTTTGDRRGLLGQAAVLANGVKGGDTSPTMRGKFIRERLLCDVVPPAPPGVDNDEPPHAANPKACKPERYAAHRQVASCAACHALMDATGFGLEAYDATGRFRATEPSRADCPIDGGGEIAGLGTFRGVSGLGDLLRGSGRVVPCLVRHYFELAIGRTAREGDQAALDALVAAMGARGDALPELVTAWVTADAFRLRAIDAP